MYKYRVSVTGGKGDGRFPVLFKNFKKLPRFWVKML